MLKVADEYACTDEGILAGDEGNCTPDGYLMCSDDAPSELTTYSTFFFCEEGGLVNMGISDINPETTCVDGQIIAPEGIVGSEGG
ncbi:hypothetical protein ABVK25_006848 [Lepraria finkii]|uniref:Uncharacterized protein n=1 Tax=Lepraria finkii TaxID=1340010 RepID=A0ABR4B663_9LECA